MNGQLTILQHNVLCWTEARRYELANQYLEIRPDIILLNSHGRKDDEAIKIYPYRFYQQNRSGESSDGVALGVRHDLAHKLIHDFTSEMLAITIMTTHGEVTIATCYLPPARAYLPQRDFYRLSSMRHPVYLLGDVNAHHPLFGYGNTNTVGRQLNMIINRGEWVHMGPDFSTYHNYRNATRPDVVLSN